MVGIPYKLTRGDYGTEVHYHLNLAVFALKPVSSIFSSRGFSYADSNLSECEIFKGAGGGRRQ